MSNLKMDRDELESVLHWRGKHTQAVKERDALQQRLNVADQRVDDLESDIAAARELLKHGSSPTPAHCESVLDFLAGQSAPEPAPNEEDWHMNPCQQGHRDVGASGGKAYCYTCDETITAATTQEAFEQWNATHPATPQ
jgi:hypothetical protein